MTQVGTDPSNLILIDNELVKESSSNIEVLSDDLVSDSSVIIDVPQGVVAPRTVGVVAPRNVTAWVDDDSPYQFEL